MCPQVDLSIFNDVHLNKGHHKEYAINGELNNKRRNLNRSI